MLWKRNIKASVHDYIKDLLDTPASGYLDQGIPDFNVYVEKEFIDKSASLTSPYIFVVDYGITSAIVRLPYIAVEGRSTVGIIAELGNRTRQKVHDFTLHVHGRTRAERDDLVSYLSENMYAIDLYDYSTNPATLLETVAIDDTIGISDVTDAEMANEEGSGSAWSLLTFSFQTWKV